MYIYYLNKTLENNKLIANFATIAHLKWETYIQR